MKVHLTPIWPVLDDGPRTAVPFTFYAEPTRSSLTAAS